MNTKCCLVLEKKKGNLGHLTWLQVTTTTQRGLDAPSCFCVLITELFMIHLFLNKQVVGHTNARNSGPPSSLIRKKPLVSYSTFFCFTTLQIISSNCC